MMGLCVKGKIDWYGCPLIYSSPRLYLGNMMHPLVTHKKRPKVYPACIKKVSQCLLNDYAKVLFANLVATRYQYVAAEKL